MTEGLSIAHLRREYALAGLRRAEMEVNPMVQFAKWFQQALDANLPEPNAMMLATVDKEGQPSSRIVLLKGADERGFIFFTNYQSRKGRELTDNPKAALTFYWPGLERQVCIAGTASRVSREESEKYFASRPRGSRLAAWVSSQSERIASREILEQKLQELTAKYPDDQVPTPSHWGGFCLAPTRIEFWQGRPNRLHDRFEYLKQQDNRWVLERLAP